MIKTPTPTNLTSIISTVGYQKDDDNSNDAILRL